MGKKGGKRMSKHQVSDLLQEYFQQSNGEVVTLRRLYKDLKLDTHPLKMLAADILEEMCWDDYLSRLSPTEYRLNLKTQVQDGVFVRKQNGKNTFIPDDGGKPLLVAERNSQYAMSGDRVRVALMARRLNHVKEGVVTEILEHKTNRVVGVLTVERDYAFLVTEDSLFPSDVIVPKKKLKGGKTGDKAVVSITQWPGRDHKTIMGEVVDILGKKGENDAEMHSILAHYGLPYRFPKNVEEAAEKISDTITAEDIAEREDFRPITTFTIDPKDAKDFDDALSIRAIDGLWEVGVHIADVTHYVKEGSVIDREAQQRATSVYLVDRTIPMLPERLCNMICSLRPDEDKLCYSVIFLLDDEAEIKHWHLAHTVIRSDRRFAYEEVQDILEQNGVVDSTGEPAPKATKAKPYRGEYATELVTLDRLAKLLRKKRFSNGAVNFDREEMHFTIDENGHPTGAYFKKSKDANKLIEEFMLLANRTVAEWVGKKTFVYRVHDQPDPMKLENLREAVVPFGYKLKTNGSRNAITKSLNKLISESAGRREQRLVETVALRAMMKAKYSTHNIGHYGLAFNSYTHFTSPIRRYPDDMVHRLLTRYQNGSRSANRDRYEELCEHSSDMEQTAANAERDSIKYKMVEYMSDFIGQEFDGHISGIQSYGIYVEIDENHCEGLVSMHDLDGDYYTFDEKNYRLVGRHHHRTYQLGDPIRIKVARANLDKRQLDFILV